MVSDSLLRNFSHIASWTAENQHIVAACSTEEGCKIVIALDNNGTKLFY